MYGKYVILLFKFLEMFNNEIIEVLILNVFYDEKVKFKVYRLIWSVMCYVVDLGDLFRFY